LPAPSKDEKKGDFGIRLSLNKKGRLHLKLIVAAAVMLAAIYPITAIVAGLSANKQKLRFIAFNEAIV